MAQSLPGADVVGIDAAAGAIARGSALARAAGLDNVELRVADLALLPDDLGPFDYLVAHGVYSWIAPHARTALLECCRDRMAGDGIAFVSYNAYPGSHLRDMTRDILRYHVGDGGSADARLARAHELMRTIVEIEDPSPYARVLREHMERMLGVSDALLFHDDLAEISTPFYFHEFMEHATTHGLRFLCEADIAESSMREVPEGVEGLLGGRGDDVLVREQYLDFFKNRMFRQTLLCRAAAPARDAIDSGALERLAISSRARRVDGAGGEERTFATPAGVGMTTSEPHVHAAMDALAHAAPRAVPFDSLLEHALVAAGPEAPAQLVAERLCDVLLEAYLARVVVLHGSPPPVARRPGERPRASPLARAQCRAGFGVVSSLLHTNVALEGEHDRELLALLDGSHGVEGLAQAASSPEEDVEAILERFAAVGLLQA
jgi:hypothetical protein